MHPSSVVYGGDSLKLAPKPFLSPLLKTISFLDPPEKWKESLVFWMTFLVTWSRQGLYYVKNAFYIWNLSFLCAMVYKSFKATGTAESEQVVGGTCSTSNSDHLHHAHNMFCNLVWALKEWPHPMWQETWLRTPHLPFHMCKRVWAWDCTQTEYWPRRQRKPVHAWIYMHGIVSPKFFLLSFSACVLSHRKSSDKWEELSHNYVLRTVYQGGFPSLELVEALHSSLNLQ